MTETLKPCRECGAPCSVQVFPNATLWVCIHNKKLEGGCRSDTAYLSAEDWNTRAPDDVAQIVAWLEKRAYYLEADFPQAQQALIDAADAIERGDWKDKDDG